MLNGLMMNRPLLITSILEHALSFHPDRKVVSVSSDDARHRTTYARIFERAGRLCRALARLGVEPGDRIGTLAWSDHRHLETYYAVSCGGAVCHTINPRLFGEQLTYIVRHAADRLLLVDPDFVPLVEGLAHTFPSVEGYVVMTDDEHMPETRLDAVSYESLLAAEETTGEGFCWPALAEDAASGLCYTSGTTGNPKGVLYSHRSTVLHALALALPDALALRAVDVVLPIVPMFHVNAWCLPHAAPMVGAGLVLPGRCMGDPAALQELIEDEGVTCSGGVPTVWLGLAAYLRETGKGLGALERVAIGGSAPPLALLNALREEHGVRHVHQAWGMTETSPLGCVNAPTPETAGLTGAERDERALKAGRGIFGVEMRVVDAEGEPLPRDGRSAGALQVRGPWVASAYYGGDGAASFTDDGWFETGDVGTLDELGYLAITDRTKDVIKSGGEWISSIELENQAMGHPAVAEAAAIGVPHPKWSERPLLVVVRRPDAALEAAELLAWLEGKVATWWLPDAVEFVDELPHTATGKVSKRRLRERFDGYELPTARESKA